MQKWCAMSKPVQMPALLQSESPGHTGREKIAYCGYHGWHDWYAVTTDLNAGIPKALGDYMLPFVYNDISSLEKLFEAHPGQIAAVSLEPVLLDAPQDRFLAQVKEVAHAHGAVLIFDEIITGFRYALGGAQDYLWYNPRPGCFWQSNGQWHAHWCYCRQTRTDDPI